MSDPYAREAAQRWPAEYVESQRQVGSLSADERVALMQRGNDIENALGAQLDEGAAPGDAAVQQLIAEHHRWVSAFWTPDREAYVGLGRMYVEDARFTAHYDAVSPGLAAFVRDAIEVWAPAHLT